MIRPVVLEPTPRVNLTRFHGVVAPNSKQGAVVVPVMRGSAAANLKPATRTAANARRTAGLVEH